MAKVHAAQDSQNFEALQIQQKPLKDQVCLRNKGHDLKDAARSSGPQDGKHCLCAQLSISALMRKWRHWPETG